jgi:hypothetical protein
MINRSILAAIVALGSLSAVHAQPALTVTTAGDWRTDGQCNFYPAPTRVASGPLALDPLAGYPLASHPAINFRIRLDKTGAPHISLWNGGQFGGNYRYLLTGTLTLSVDGRSFQPLHTAFVANDSAVATYFPPEILAAMHDGQTVRIEYQDGTDEASLIHEQSLAGFAGLVDACRALERRYNEQEARATPDTKADLTLLCGDQTVQVWVNAGMLTWDTAAHRQVWRLDRVGAAEIAFKRLGRYADNDILFASNGLLPSGPSFADLDGQIDRVSGAFSRSDGSHGTCASAAAKF